MKLEEIAPYYPYKVRASLYCENDDKSISYERDGELIAMIEESKNQWPLRFRCKIKQESKLYAELAYPFHLVKLHLRPLSDLTKPCLQDGKIPIVELAKLSEGENININKVKSKWDLHGVKFIDMDGDECVFAFHCKISSFGLHVCDTEEMQLVHKQLQLFQKLLEWHFDLFDLIEKGEAIDVNTLSL